MINKGHRRIFEYNSVYNDNEKLHGNNFNKKKEKEKRKTSQ